MGFPSARIALRVGFFYGGVCTFHQDVIRSNLPPGRRTREHDREAGSPGGGADRQVVRLCRYVPEQPVRKVRAAAAPPLTQQSRAAVRRSLRGRPALERPGRYGRPGRHRRASLRGVTDGTAGRRVRIPRPDQAERTAEPALGRGLRGSGNAAHRTAPACRSGIPAREGAVPHDRGP